MIFLDNFKLTKGHPSVVVLRQMPKAQKKEMPWRCKKYLDRAAQGFEPATLDIYSPHVWESRRRRRRRRRSMRVKGQKDCAI